jgi:branched-chain amino acid transport system substrate-binding protein
VKTINSNKINAVALGGYGSSLGILIKQLREFGYKGPIYGTPDMGYPNVLDVVKENLGEAYIVDFDVDKNNPKVQKFMEDYKTIHSQEPSMDAFIGYDGLNLFIKACESLSNDKSKSLIEIIKTIDSFDGVTGKIKILESGDILFPLTLKKL